MNVDRLDEAWKGDGLEFVVNEGADAFGEGFAVGTACEGLPIKFDGHETEVCRTGAELRDKAK